jgi:hypothetical protein
MDINQGTQILQLEADFDSQIIQMFGSNLSPGSERFIKHQAANVLPVSLSPGKECVIC